MLGRVMTAMAAGGAALAWAGQAFAQGASAVTGPTAGGVYFQQAANEMKREIVAFSDMLHIIMAVITLFVLALLGWVIVRYNRAANPTPRQFSHNTTVEVLWTIIPVLILVGISVVSFPLLAKEERVPEKYDLTLKAVGHSWFWEHDYPDYGVNIISNMLPEEDLAARGLTRADYKQATDEPIVVPVGATVRLLVTSADVIHSWSMPSFGVKEDAIPGRVNEGWFVIDRPGTYYGLCQELCGIRHAFMPIEVRAVPQAEFEQWVRDQGGALPGATAEAAATETQPS